MSPMIYVGGLTSSATDTRVFLLCAPHRTVTSACVIKSKIIGQPFGYGFVVMGSTEQAGKRLWRSPASDWKGNSTYSLCQAAHHSELASPSQESGNLKLRRV